MTRSDIDHYNDLAIWGPVTPEDLQQLLDPLPLQRRLAVLDVGCGKATALIDCARRLGAAVTGVDRSGAALRIAEETIERIAPEATANWIECAMNDLAFDDHSFDLIMALGGPYRNDSFEETLRLYARWMRPDGHLLYGDGFWVKAPPAEYLDATGLGADALLGRDAYLQCASQCGLESIDHHVATREAWDRFEGTIHGNHEAYARAHADEPGIDAMIAGKRSWNAAQEQWGRDTMGFVVDVFRRTG